jgi:ParB family chromosome partitioning protein
MSKIDRAKPRLGRGLSSLLSISDSQEPNPLPVMITLPPPATEPAAESVAPTTADVRPTPSATALPRAAGGVLEIAVDAIVPNPHQPRKIFDESTLAELAASLKTTGVIQPIIVRAVADGYQLIAGERRWRAAKLAGLVVIPAIVRETSSATQAQMALVENIQREDLNPVDRAQSYRSLMDQLGLTQAELASRLGEERSGIANYLRLLNLVEPVRELVRSGRLSFGHAKLLAGVEDMLQQERLAQTVMADELSVRQLEKMLQARPSDATGSTSHPAGPSPHIRDLEQSLSRQLGMRVQVRTRGKKGAGQLVIRYSSLDQFDDLLARLGTKAEST